MAPILTIENLNKTYDGGFQALKDVSLDIQKGEILALLGPNGAGKTTLISVICGLVNASSGTVRVGGHNITTDFRAARKMIGLVPQEISIEPFEKVIATAQLSRGLFGKPRNDAHIEEVLRALSLWDKKDSRTRELSGGMKRRVLIAKALAHEPQVLFLDEPSAGVDVELRKDMWELVRRLRDQGVTIILTTHYIEEAEEIADRIAVINKGEILLVEEKAELLRKMGRKLLHIYLQSPITALPDALAEYDLDLSADGGTISYSYDTRGERTGITRLMQALADAGLSLKDIATEQSSLEDIFVSLVKDAS